MNLHCNTSHIEDNTFLLFCQQTLCDLINVFNIDTEELLNNREPLENPLLFTQGLYITEIMDIEVPEEISNEQELLHSNFTKKN